MVSMKLSIPACASQATAVSPQGLIPEMLQELKISAVSIREGNPGRSAISVFF